MASVDGDLEEQLLEAGKALLIQSMGEINELPNHLNQVGKLLGKVEQSPSKSMLTALSPTIQAVVKNELLRNENEDVRVAVASCISEITRITAPDAPYEDNQMKEVFQLIVSSFKNLSDNSSQSYSKRTSILETVAKVRSCVVMLDLECDGLIVEMFQHFLKEIRDHHPDNVFSSMEIIMTLVLEESEDIGFELISPLLACLKKDNQEVLPIARKLAENVIQKSTEKIKPCMLEAKMSMNFSYDDYSTIIAEVCEETDHVRHGNHKSPGEQLTQDGVADGASSGGAVQGDENKLNVPSSDEASQDQVVKESEAETPNGQDHHAPVESVPAGDLSAPVTGPEEDHPVPMEIVPEDNNPAPVETSPREEHPVPVESELKDDQPDPAPSSKSASSNGVAEIENEDVSASPPSSEKPEHTNEDDRSHDDANVAGKAEPDDSDSGKVAKVETKSGRVSKKRSKTPKHPMKPSVPSESSYTDTDTEKETKQIIEEEIILDKEAHASPSRDPSTEVAVDNENDSETEQLSSPKALESEPENVVSPSPSKNALDEGRSRKGRRSKKNKKSSKNTSQSKDVTTKVTTVGTSNSEVKLPERSGKRALVSDSPAEKAQVPVKKSKVEVGSESDSEIKEVKRSSRKADTKNHIGEGSSSKKKVDDKRRGKTTPENVETVSVPKPSKVVKDDSPLKEILKTSSKRKRTPTKEKVTDAKKNDEDLVGSRIKVWWPMDEMFYDGVVESFHSKSKKHMVAYADGDQELLNLREETWELVEEDDSIKDGDQETGAESPDTSPEMQKKKKAKADSETPAKKGKTQSVRDVEASSSRSKATGKKPSLKEDVKAAKVTPKSSTKEDVKAAKVTPKSSAKSEDAGGKSKVRSKKPGGKSSVDASEKAGKSKDDDNDTPKPSIKFKLGAPKTVTKVTPKAATQEEPKTSTKGKPKTPTNDKPKTAVKDTIKSGAKGDSSKSGSKSTPSSSAGKVKSGSAKSKESKEREESPEVLVKAGKSGKGKSAETTPKAKESEGKSGKKRRRS